jgi:hypothetical protein
MLSNIHTILVLMAFLAKPMFKVNKPLFILEQTKDVTWQNIPRFVKKYFVMLRIPCDVAKYFATSHNNIHLEK